MGSDLVLDSLLLFGYYLEHLGHLQAVLDCISVVMIVEVAKDLLCLLGCSFYLGHPRFEFFGFVVVIVPRLFAFAVPSNIGDVSSYMHVRWQQRLVYSSVSHLVLLQEPECLRVRPRWVTKLHGQPELSWKQSEEAFEQVEVEFESRRQLGQEAGKFAIELQRLH